MRLLLACGAGILSALAVLLCFTGCKREEGPPPTQLPKAAAPAAAAAERTSFAQVTSQLDPGGSVYLYLGTEQWLAGLAGRVAGWRTLLEAVPNISDEDRQNLTKVLNLVTNLIQQSGVEEVSGLGVSSVARETNFYHSKVILYHYPGQGSGFLWNLFGRKPHTLDGLNLLPATTALAAFTDLDAPMLWSVVQKQVAQAGFPQAQALLDKLPENFHQATGLEWDRVLASLGGELGLAVTLDDTKVIPIPVGGEGNPPQIPEPGLLLVAKVIDDTIFNRIDQALQQGAGQQLIKADKPGLKIRTWPLPLALPVRLRPTFAATDGFLLIATSDALINEVLAAKLGQKPGLKSSQEFQRLAKDVPSLGNGFSFTSARFGQAIRKIQQAALQAKSSTTSPQTAWLRSFIGSGPPVLSYTVAANTDEGWVAVGNGNQHAGRRLAIGAAVPVGMLAAIAIPNFVNARHAAQKNTCVTNLRQIDAAKQQWALENKKADTDVPTPDDLKPYLKLHKLPTCPAGGTYNLHHVADLPACSVPGHKLGD